MKIHSINIEMGPDGKIPEYAHGIEDACCDLYSAIDYSIKPGETKLIKTDTKVEVPKGMVMLVCSRSGLALKHSVFVLNAPGVVDPGYRGDVGVILHNASWEPFVVNKGDRIAQAMFVETTHVSFLRIDSLSESNRGEGGFGSTGKQ